MFSREDHSSLWIFLDDHGIIAVLSSGLHCTLWITSVCVYWPQAPLFNITSSSLQHRGIVLLLLCWSPTCVITSRVISRDTATAHSAWGISNIHNSLRIEAWSFSPPVKRHGLLSSHINALACRLSKPAFGGSVVCIPTRDGASRSCTNTYSVQASASPTELPPQCHSVIYNSMVLARRRPVKGRVTELAAGSRIQKAHQRL